LADRGGDERAFFEQWSPDAAPGVGVPVGPPSLAPATPVPPGDLPERELDDARVAAVQARLEAEEARPASRMEVDGANVVRSATGPGTAFLGIPTERLEGLPFPAAMARVEEAFGALTGEAHDPLDGGAVEHRVTYTAAGGSRTVVRGITLVGADGRTTTVAVRRSP
jgi:hypothetical protein